MDAEGNFQRFGTLQDRPEGSVIQVAAPGVAVDPSSLEAMFMNHAFQLIGSDPGGSGWQGGESGETFRITPHRSREIIVRFAGERN